jgi:hypothetical protein
MVQKVGEAVERVLNANEQEFPIAASVGDAVRQGDIYIQKIDDIDPSSTPLFYRRLDNSSIKWPLQLADGNTKGSRHMLEASPGVVVYINEHAEWLNTLSATERAAAIANSDTSQELVQALNVFESDKSNQLFEQRDKLLNKSLVGLTKEQKREHNNEIARLASTRDSIDCENIVNMLNFCGPIFVLKAKGKIPHPEHGDWLLPPGTYRIVYQRTINDVGQTSRVID